MHLGRFRDMRDQPGRAATLGAHGAERACGISATQATGAPLAPEGVNALCVRALARQEGPAAGGVFDGPNGSPSCQRSDTRAQTGRSVYTPRVLAYCHGPSGSCQHTDTARGTSCQRSDTLRRSPRRRGPPRGVPVNAPNDGPNGRCVRRWRGVGGTRPPRAATPSARRCQRSDTGRDRALTRRASVLSRHGGPC